VQKTELVLGVGEELFYDFGEAPVDEILKDFNPESL